MERGPQNPDSVKLKSGVQLVTYIYFLRPTSSFLPAIDSLLDKVIKSDDGRHQASQVSALNKFVPDNSIF